MRIAVLSALVVLACAAATAQPKDRGPKPTTLPAVDAAIASLEADRSDAIAITRRAVNGLGANRESRDALLFTPPMFPGRRYPAPVQLRILLRALAEEYAPRAAARKEWANAREAFELVADTCLRVLELKPPHRFRAHVWRGAALTVGELDARVSTTSLSAVGIDDLPRGMAGPPFSTTPMALSSARLRRMRAALRRYARLWLDAKVRNDRLALSEAEVADLAQEWRGLRTDLAADFQDLIPRPTSGPD